MTDIYYMPAAEMTAAIRAKQISPLEVIDKILERIEVLNPQLRAFISASENTSRDQAREAESAIMRGDELGPLHGVPVSVKDNLFTEGIKTTYGSRVYEAFVPDKDDAAVERLKSAGAIILGKTNLPEFGYKASSMNTVFGTTPNPWNLEKTSGGSSGGAAVAVAAGMGPLALGTDAGGSARIPCSFCGIYGIKPQAGRVPGGPGFRPLRDLGHTCPMTRTVEDAALMLDAIASPEASGFSKLPPKGISYLGSLNRNIRGLRIGWSRDLGYLPVRKEIQEITESAVSIFEELGCKVEEARINLEGCEEIFRCIAWAEWYWRFKETLRKHGPLLDPGFVELLEKGKRITIDQYLRAQDERADFFMKMKRSFGTFDLLLTPAVSTEAFERDRDVPNEVVTGTGRWSKGWTLFSLPFSLTGQPAASVPCGYTSEGLPVGLQIVGKPFDEISVLNASAAFEEVTQWAADFPPEIRN